MSAPAHSRSALGAFIRASSLRIGAAAATASLRDELVKDHGLTPDDVDAAYAEPGQAAWPCSSAPRSDCYDRSSPDTVALGRYLR